MTGLRLCLAVERWPDIDRELWLDAQTPAGFLEGDKPASHWSPASRTIAEQAYGQWLAFLDRKGVLNRTCTPGERAADAPLREFIVELQSRVAPATIALRTGALLRMLTVLEPQRDWTMLAKVHAHLKRTAVPSRNKLARMVAAPELLELGIRLMETWDSAPHKMFKATRFRNGLLIALLICCPIRAKNFAGLMIGRHLVFDGKGYRLELAAAETKTHRPYIADVPSELTAYIDRWLRVHRPALQAVARTDAGRRRQSGSHGGLGDHLWLDCWGRPMNAKAIQRQFALQTERAFGKAIRPHLFRDCAVTELVDCAPEEIAIAPDLLGHADLRTTRKHYIHAQGMTAHARIQDMIASRRRAATSPSDS